MEKPKTLQEAIRYFSEEQTCIDTVAKLRWPAGKPICPACGKKDHYYLASQKRWKCKECWKQFSVKLGTILEDSPISLDKWLTALWMLVNCKKGLSSYEVARALGITQKSAWFVLYRLRLAMQSRSLAWNKGVGQTAKLKLDETYVGGKVRNMHKGKKLKLAQVRSEYSDTADFLCGTAIKPSLWECWIGKLQDSRECDSKRAARCAAELVFRHNNRGTKENPMKDVDRFEMALLQIAGHRLTFEELTR